MNSRQRHSKDFHVFIKPGSVAAPTAWVFGLVFLLWPVYVSAGDPTDQIRATVDSIQEILRDPQLASDTMRAERRDRLRSVIYRRFDFTEMAKRSLGPDWRKRTPAEQQEFVDVFTKLLEKSYLDKIESYHGEKILYVREAQEGDFAEVDTKVVDDQGDQFAIDYRMHQIDRQWKVYDVVIENISLVNNYRAQFSRVLASSSFAELLRRIKEKI